MNSCRNVFVARLLWCENLHKSPHFPCRAGDKLSTDDWNPDTLSSLRTPVVLLLSPQRHRACPPLADSQRKDTNRIRGRRECDLILGRSRSSRSLCLCGESRRLPSPRPDPVGAVFWILDPLPRFPLPAPRRGEICRLPSLSPVVILDSGFWLLNSILHSLRCPPLKRDLCFLRLNADR